MTKNELIYDDINKYEQLLKVSNPKKVIENSIKYFNDPNIKVYLSTTRSKKYMIYDDKNKKIHFGHIAYQDYTKHNDPIRRIAYLNRAFNIRGNWHNNKYSPNNLAIALLWDGLEYFK